MSADTDADRWPVVRLPEPAGPFYIVDVAALPRGRALPGDVVEVDDGTRRGVARIQCLDLTTRTVHLVVVFYEPEDGADG